MAFTRTFYEADSGDIHPIRITPESLAAAGAVPAGPVTNNIPAKITKGNRQFGLRPRGVRIARQFGTAPDTFYRYRFIPVLSEASFGVAPFVINGSVTYDGAAWTVVNVVGEDYA